MGKTTPRVEKTTPTKEVKKKRKLEQMQIEEKLREILKVLKKIEENTNVILIRTL